MEYGSPGVDWRSIGHAFFASITIVSAFCLCNCYVSPHPDSGPNRNPSYLQAIWVILGRRSTAVCSIFLRINFFKARVIYTMTTAISMRAIEKSNCYHKEGHNAACGFDTTTYVLFFGIVQTAMSQMPNFRDIEWLSIVAAAMSFYYSIIGLALGLAKVIGMARNKLCY